jgi:hypothetical protein
MTTLLYNAPGRIEIKYIVQSVKRNRRFTTEETGFNSTLNVKRAVEDKSFIENCRLNAVYKHMAKGGNSSAITTLISYRIKYFRDLVSIEKRDTPKGQYHYVVEKKTGKVLSRQKREYRLELE